MGIFVNSLYAYYFQIRNLTFTNCCVFTRRIIQGVLTAIFDFFWVVPLLKFKEQLIPKEYQIQILNLYFIYKWYRVVLSLKKLEQFIIVITTNY